jgi:S-DNA-T family DNA segregation ATPase FtsK/SpoIIIE
MPFNLPLPLPSPRSSRYLRRSFRMKLKKSTLFSVGSILFLALGGLIMVSFIRQGSLLIELNNLIINYFGWTGILLPFVLIIAGLLLTKLKTPVNEPNVLVGGILLLLSLMGLFRQGSLGKQIWEGTASLITGLGALIIILGGLLISLVVLFNTSIDQVVQFFLRLLEIIKTYLFGFRKVRERFPEVRPQVKISGVSPATEPEQRSKPTEEGLPGLTKTIPAVQTKIWQYPPLSLLADEFGGKADRGDVKANADVIEKTLDSFGISARVAEVNGGPAVTQYALEVALGTKLSKITGLSNDLALALAAPTGQIRIEAPIPGRSLVGIELPNRSPEFVTLKKMLTADSLKKSKSKLSVALGLDVSGRPLAADIARMPHVLIAGATGSGKTVCLNSFICTVLFRASPNEVKFILVDPKRVELIQYNGIPHLLTPVIVEPEKVVSALKWAIGEMDRRYKLFAETGVRNIDAYNELSGFTALPYIIIIVDELADIMLFAPVEVEDTICRIAQMARATGIHLIISTQRPSVDVLTGLIKANIPCRISFAVSSMVDSRVIIDQGGAEKLLGRGDMLYIPPDQAKPTRIQGALVSEPEIQKVIAFLRKEAAPAYTEEVTTMPVKTIRGAMVGTTEEKDELFDEALRTVCQYDRASASLLQRRLSIGYARAARILDQLEAAGVVGPAEGSKPRDVLIRSPEEASATTSEA